jgi:release factor glutamine methyltransferase
MTMISQNAMRVEAGRPSLRQALLSGVQGLRRAGIGTARLDAEVMLGHVLAMTTEQLVSMPDMPLTGEQTQRYEATVRRRLEREPVAYITGQQEFWSLDLHVTPDVLIPRPETERLVEVALTVATSRLHATPMRLLDIGTGSGAVAISLAKELASAKLWATDVSTAAVAIARGNAARNGVSEKIKFLCGDLFVPIDAAAGEFALIVANPPYIRGGEIAGLAPEVSHWEPRLALDGGTDGLDFYRRIAARASCYLALHGAVALEIGSDMGEAVAKLFDANGGYESANIFQDYAGRDRVVVAQKLRQIAG